VNDEWIIRERDNVTFWINQSNECIENECDNATGGFSTVTCRDENGVENMCVDGICDIKHNKDDKIRVEFDFDEEYIDKLDVNSTETRSVVSEMTGIDRDKITIGVEYNSEGHAYRLVVFVFDESDAQRVLDSFSILCQ